ncbi:hypothetical protein F4820DRAFT_460732 [Hypoxylon rubiginosum]|uniref:Uncharacterized protein n=1 Tax=Hypoxylon rubiginosum TaxID=110542 RepID=A0ACB9YQZ6_9PEZI|nr:hypothetical protein F4820DRAFT_460732 [Hypoxylon rubiginosum]
MVTVGSLAAGLLLTVVGGAALPPRQFDNTCCFQLASVGRVNKVNKPVLEDHVGDLLLGGSFQQGTFCLDRSTKTIQDSLKHNCFMRAPDYQFECYQGAVGTTTFDTKIVDDNGKAYLLYDDGPGVFFACPAAEGADGYYDIFSTDKANRTGCEPVSLALVDELDTCFLGNATATNATITDATVAQRSAATEVDTPPPTLPAAPQECVVSPSAPSIAPYKTVINNGNSISWSGKNATALASVTPTNTTTFYFDIPQRFSASASLCALQFRMPACEALPAGYPCYRFSGMEQEILQNSGMTFSRSGTTLPGWSDTEVHHVQPGGNTVIGTFECNQAAGPHGWRASSVRDFVLEFVQAGVGPNAKFRDGVGAWVVECEQPFSSQSDEMVDNTTKLVTS